MGLAAAVGELSVAVVDVELAVEIEPQQVARLRGDAGDLVGRRQAVVEHHLLLVGAVPGIAARPRHREKDRFPLGVGLVARGHLDLVVVDQEQPEADVAYVGGDLGVADHPLQSLESRGFRVVGQDVAQQYRVPPFRHPHSLPCEPPFLFGPEADAAADEHGVDVPEPRGDLDVVVHENGPAGIRRGIVADAEDDLRDLRLVLACGERPRERASLEARQHRPAVVGVDEGRTQGEAVAEGGLGPSAEQAGDVGEGDLLVRGNRSESRVGDARHQPGG